MQRMSPKMAHFSSRYMRTDTIGKYGVGAKLAALNFGRKIDVYSRQRADAPWLHVSFDLDEALDEEKSSGEPTALEVPAEAEVPEELKDLIPEGSGTLVVWSKVDKLEEGRVFGTFDELLVDVQKELARIYREFITGGIAIVVNGLKLMAHDPLFLMEGTWADHVLTKEAKKSDGARKTHFPATLIADEFVTVKGSKARVRITLYPEEVTRERGRGADELAKKLRVPDNEGAISFMRKGREITYSNVPRVLPGGVENLDRFIGIEVSFEPELDDYFGVRNVKRGVEPHGELRARIRDVLRRYIKTTRQKIQERWGAVENLDKGRTGKFGPTMDRVKEADAKMPKGPRHDVDPEKERQAFADLARDTGHESEDDKKAYLERIRSLPFVLETVDFPGKQFIDVQHIGDKVIIRLNTRHRFYRELWSPLERIAEMSPGSVSGEDATASARRAVVFRLAARRDFRPRHFQVQFLIRSPEI